MVNPGDDETRTIAVSKMGRISLERNKVAYSFKIAVSISMYPKEHRDHNILYDTDFLMISNTVTQQQY